MKKHNRFDHHIEGVVRKMDIRGSEEGAGPKSGASKRNPKDPDREIIRRLRIQNNKLLEQVGFLKTQAKLLNADKHQLVRRLQEFSRLSNMLSDALGSCQLCWGEDPQCPSCEGNGFPGWKKVHKRRFQVYVMPALKSYME